MAKEGSVAPKERVNIVYKPATGDAVEEKELPLKMLMMGDYTGRKDDTPLGERKIISVNKDNFSDVMQGQDLNLKFGVENKLDESGDAGDMAIDLKINTLKSFNPEEVAKQVPELKKLLDLRNALTALKGPLGNIPAFRKKIQQMVGDDAARAKIMAELAGGDEAPAGGEG